MRELFQQDLEQVGDDLVAMARLAEQAMQEATTSLLTRDLQLAEQVIERDQRIDVLQDELDQQCIALLARQAPVASDLRIVVTGLRLSATLERMGDLARHIAEVARGRYPDSAVPEPAMPLFSEMGAAAVRVGGDVVELLEGRDVTLAQQVLQDDDALDKLHAESFRLMLAPSATPSEFTAQQIVDITLLGRYFERYGDHGTAVARRIMFLVTGEQPISA